MKKKISKLLVIVFFLLITIFFLHSFDGNADFYHHVNTGRFVIENKSLPQLDVFSHTAEGMPWIAHSWASGVIFYLVLTTTGPTGISILITLTATLTFILLYKLLLAYEVSRKITLLSILLAVGLISLRFPQRPEVFSYPLAISLLLINKLKNKNKNLALLLPVLILLWVNLYGSGSLLALILVGFFAAKQFIEDKFRVQSSQKLFYLSCLICLPVSLINGYGLNSLLYIYFYIPQVARYEGEWAGIFAILKYFAPSYLLSFQYQILVFFLYLGLFSSLILVNLKKITQKKLLSVFSLSILIPFYSLRHLPLATIFSLPFFAKVLDEQNGIRRKIFLTATFFTAVFSILISVWLNPPSFKQGSDLSQQHFLDFINKYHLNGKAFNHSHLGSLITYRFYPQILVFYDTRDEVYLKSPALNDLYELFSTGTSIMPILEKYNIDLVLGDLVNDGINYREMFRSPKWAIVFFDDRFFIAVPKDTALQKNIPVLDFLDPFSEAGVKPGFEKEALAYYKNLNPKSFSNQFLLVNILISFNNLPEALDTLKHIPVPTGPIKNMLQKDRDYLIASIYLKQNNCSEAKTYLNYVDQESKGLLIFKPNEILSSSVNKGWAFYYLNCEKNLPKAKYYLDLYLSRKDINPLEKAKTENAFNKSQLN